MGEKLKKYRNELATLVFLLSLTSMATVFFLWWLSIEVLELNVHETMVIAALFSLSTAGVLSLLWNRYITKPIEIIVSTLGHLEPGDSLVASPELKSIVAGREIVDEISSRIYELASKQTAVPQEAQGEDNSDTLRQAIFNLTPTPIITLDKAGNISNFNLPAKSFLNDGDTDVIGRPFLDVFNLSFSGAESFDVWIKKCRIDQVTATNVWQRVKQTKADSSEHFFDMAAYFSRDETHGLETVIALMDFTQRYSNDEESMSYVALAVHELRTPVTILRGYIEVFEDELGATMEPELLGFMKKMEVSAAQLAMFINNILNVSRIDNSQMPIDRVEVDWLDFVKNSIESDFKLRAEVHGKTVDLQLPEKLASVAADPVSMYEVLSNLLDNAIKYSKDGGVIEVSVAQSDENTVITTVRDHGIGIPESVIGHLFEKFYRSHRSRQSVGGTGLGLFLSKTIIEAHGGYIQVQSVEGQGATFSFTLPSHASVAQHLDEPHNDGIERGSHGWIKNHSLHRR